MEGKSGQEICFPPQPFNGLSISYAVKEGIIEIADFVTHIAALCCDNNELYTVSLRNVSAWLTPLG